MKRMGGIRMKTRLAALLLCVLPLLCKTVAASDAQYVIVIRNGRVLDGSGNPWVPADVAIKNGRFAKIGRVAGHGKREIDAAGDYVSPGWIDMMDQSGAVLLRNGLAENMLREGVTTAIAGESGMAVPAAQAADYFDRLEKQGISLNFGSYYGAGQARMEVMGDADSRPTPEQMEQMKAHVDQAMRAGAMGIATALIYPPQSFQTTQDLIELARVAGKYGGIYASHLRDESAGLLGAIGESIKIGEQAGVQVEVFHFKAAYAPGWGKLVWSAFCAPGAARRLSACVPTWMRCPCPNTIDLPTNRPSVGACTAVATMGTRPCCWGRRSTCPRIAISMERWCSSSSRPRKAATPARVP